MRQLFLTPPQAKIDPPIPQDKPVYRNLNEKGFFGPDHCLYPEGSIFVLWDEPNLDMEPLNDMARDRLEKVAEKQEQSGKEVANFNGRYFAPNQTKQQLLENAVSDARRVSSINGEKGIAILGKKLEGSDRIEAVGPQEVPERGDGKVKKQRARVETISG